LANKQYKSIIRLFEYCAIPTGEELNLGRARKQLQAEFRAARDGFIEADGFSYTSQEVFEEIEHEDFPKRLQWHQKIWQHKTVLQLLEKNTAPVAALGEALKPFLHNREFDQFFSPYFVAPFAYISRTLLAANKLNDMGVLLAYEDFLQPAEREEAFRPLRLYLDENIRILRNVNKENYRIMRPKIMHWIEDEWSVMLNNLPHELYDLKLDITIKLLNLTVFIQRTHRKECRKVSYQLVALSDLPENIMDRINKNHHAYVRFENRESSGAGCWGFILIFIIIKLFTLRTCDSRPKSQYKFPTLPHSTIDSILRKMHDSANRSTPDTFIIAPEVVVPERWNQ